MELGPGQDVSSVGLSERLGIPWGAEGGFALESAVRTLRRAGVLIDGWAADGIGFHRMYYSRRTPPRPPADLDRIVSHLQAAGFMGASGHVVELKNAAGFNLFWNSLLVCLGTGRDPLDEALLWLPLGPRSGPGEDRTINDSLRAYQIAFRSAPDNWRAEEGGRFFALGHPVCNRGAAFYGDVQLLQSCGEHAITNSELYFYSQRLLVELGIWDSLPTGSQGDLPGLDRHYEIIRQALAGLATFLQLGNGVADLAAMDEATLLARLAPYPLIES